MRPLGILQQLHYREALVFVRAGHAVGGVSVAREQRCIGRLTGPRPKLQRAVFPREISWPSIELPPRRNGRRRR
jgi:hypothetical protein